MKLTLSGDNPTNMLLTGDDGKARYACKTPSKLSKSTTFIYRLQSDFTPHQELKGEDEGRGSEDEELLHGVGVTELAQIHWQYIGSSTLRYKEKEISFSEYLHSEDIFGL
jgi:hypothetical protein